MDNFVIAVAQTDPLKGNAEANLQDHARFIRAAAEHNTSVINFPELPLTGYEPDLAAELTMSLDDERLDAMRELAIRHEITIIAGTPLENPNGRPFIGSMIFGPETQQLYLKQHLHPGEEKYFSVGTRAGTLDVNGVTVGLAICADISVESHAEEAAGNGASVYAASVFTTPEGYAKDTALLRSYASGCRMVIAMANFCGNSGNMTAAGRSAVWDDRSSKGFPTSQPSRFP